MRNIALACELLVFWVMFWEYVFPYTSLINTDTSLFTLAPISFLQSILLFEGILNWNSKTRKRVKNSKTWYNTWNMCSTTWAYDTIEEANNPLHSIAEYHRNPWLLVFAFSWSNLLFYVTYWSSDRYIYFNLKVVYARCREHRQFAAPTPVVLIEHLKNCFI